MSKKVKTFAILAGVVIVIIVAVSFLKGKSATPAPSSTNGLSSSTGTIPLPGAVAPQNADEFSTILSTINHISIDTSLFQNPSYKLLRDVPVSLGSDVVGRSNPFAPIGSDGPTATIADVVVQTVQAGKVTSTTAEFAAQITVSDTAPTSVVFEYGPTDTFGNATAPVTTTKSGTVLMTVTGLTPSTSYYVRAVAVRGGVTTTGNTTSFVTTRK
jgi:hypothetical protein